MSTGNGAGRVQTVAIARIHPAEENWEIYRKPDYADPTFIDLCTSIREGGIKSPLDITRDHFVLSGHRRYLAALACGLTRIPCIVDPSVVWSELDRAARLSLLTERNKGVRIKSDRELYLEVAAKVDPEEAVRQAQARKARVLNKVKMSVFTEVEETGGISRTDPSGERAELLAAVREILEEKRAAGYLPTSGRHIHYRLLQKNVRTSTRKNGYIYGTRSGSDKLLSKLLTDARSAGLIDHDDINDATRLTTTFPPSGTIGHFINAELGGLFQNFFGDVHADQPNHVEIILEKNTVYQLLVDRVAWPFRLPISSLHGYGSFPAARDVAQRFNRSGKDNLAVIYISDLDPEGVNMPSSWKKYLSYDFNIDVSVFRAAVTPVQVEKYHLPRDADVKLSSSRAASFIEQYGRDCWELDSMPEQVLIDEVSGAVQSVLDIDALNRAFAREKEADVKLARIRAQIRAFVSNTLGQSTA